MAGPRQVACHAVGCSESRLLKENVIVDCRGFAWLLSCLVLLIATRAEAETPIAVGDVVIVVQPTQLKVGDSGMQPVRQGALLSVEAVQGDWLWVSYGKSGWLYRPHTIARDQAVEFFSQRILRNPADVDAYQARGKVFLSLGDSGRALADFQQAIQQRPSPLSYSDRGLAWSMAGQYDKAIDDFNSALQLQTSQALSSFELAGIFCMRGMAWIAKGDASRAIADLDEAVRLSPDFAFGFNQRGRARLAEGISTVKAVADFGEAIRLNPVYGAAFNNRGVAWATMGEFANALADFRRAVALAGDAVFLPDTRSRLVYDAARRARRPLDAQSTEQLDPLESAMNNLALLLAACPDDALRNGKEAVQQAEQLCKLDGYQYYPFLTTLAAAYAETGDFASAVQWQRKALEAAPEKKKPELQSRLTLYESGKPYRQQPKNNK